MDFSELQELIRILEESSLSEIEIEEDGSRIRLQKPGASSAVQYVYPPPPAPHAPASEPSAGDEWADPSAAPPPSDGTVTIDSPMVGTFYLAPAPGEPPFVQAGDHIDEDQTVCIVEAMKLMNEVTAKVVGTIERILVENGEPVEFGQSLFKVRPLEPSEG